MILIPKLWAEIYHILIPNLPGSCFNALSYIILIDVFEALVVSLCSI